MALMDNHVSDNIGGGYGMGFGGGGIVAFLVILLVIWLLLERKDGHRDGGYGHAQGGGCNPFVTGTRPVYMDESNYEQDYKNLKEFDKVDRDVILGNEKILNKLAENELAALREKLEEARFANMELKQSAYLTTVIGGVERTLGAKIDKVDEIVERLPKPRPEWAQTVLPCASTIPNNCFSGESFRPCGAEGF